MLSQSALETQLSSAFANAETSGRSFTSTEEARAGRAPVLETLIVECAQAVADYLNTAQDPTLDGPLVPVTAPQCRGLVAPLFDFSTRQERSYEAMEATAHAAVNTAWLSLFPWVFGLAIFVPPIIAEVTAACPIPGTLPPFLELYRKDTQADFIGAYAGALHTAVTSTVCTITTLVASPSGPVPGPVITGPLI